MLNGLRNRVIRQCVMNQKILVSKSVWLLKLCTHTGFSLLEGDEGIPPTSRVSPSEGRHRGHTIPHPLIFFETPPPSKPMPPMGCSPYLKRKPTRHPPHLKNNPLPLKNEVPFQKMSSRKKYPKNWKLPLILVFHSQNNTGNSRQKFLKNVIFSLAAFKISQKSQTVC